MKAVTESRDIRRFVALIGSSGGTWQDKLRAQTKAEEADPFRAGSIPAVR